METYDCAVQREPQLKFIYILTNTTKYNQIQSTSTSHANNIQKRMTTTRSYGVETRREGKRERKEEEEDEYYEYDK